MNKYTQKIINDLHPTIKIKLPKPTQRELIKELVPRPKYIRMSLHDYFDFVYAKDRTQIQNCIKVIKHK